MEKQDTYSENFPGLDYSLGPNVHHHHLHHALVRSHSGEASGSGENSNNNNGMNDYMLLHSTSPMPHHNPHIGSSGFFGSGSLDKLSFADVMQFADFGPKLALNQSKNPEDETGVDPVCFLKFPVLNDKSESQCLIGDIEDRANLLEEGGGGDMDGKEARVSNNNSLVQLGEAAGDPISLIDQKSATIVEVKNNKRKRPRTVKTTEEVESQRMTHIAVERNRRRQMNEHLRVLRSLMPGSYVQRGDQASIIGGAIEFVRELEQLLQCLESQKRRRLYGDGGGAPPQMGQQLPPSQPQLFPTNTTSMPVPADQMNKLVDFDTGLREEIAESKSFHADIEVKVLGFDAMIKILSRRRPGQLIKTIAALEDLQLTILHTNITTIEHTVLYSFNVKVASETRFTAEDIACSVQQIFSFIHANSSI
ncbi:hypothetical protein SAY87_009413 [Trapa incisa]|uniref:BHLH domain-containing protein n=1 Tax=Trapa incisa TaxID=236973 RepID=A0AAN7PXH8_9MYRT|nr:hypothetical protein SAY87_009413 [Trapa incisa]